MACFLHITVVPTTILDTGTVMKKLLYAVAFGIGLLAMAGTVHAGPVTIVFQNPDADMPVAGNFTTGGTCNGIAISGIDLCTIDDALGFEFSEDWAALNVTAYNGAGLTSLLLDLSPSNSGLAVLSPGESSSDDQLQFANSESVLFNFGTEILLQGVDFNAGADTNCATPGNEGPCGTFDLFVDGIYWNSYTAVDDMLFANIAGSMFEVVATGREGGFTIGSIAVDRIEVSEPGTLAILGLGLIGMAARRKKKV